VLLLVTLMELLLVDKRELLWAALLVHWSVAWLEFSLVV
jgi:hypothetical protein